MKKYTLGTRTSAVVFALLVLKPQDQDPRGLINQLLPNNTKVWKQWKETILKRHQNNQPFREVYCPDGFTQEEKNLLEVLHGDAVMVQDWYIELQDLL